MKPLIIANWKMNPQTLAEAKQLFDLIKRGLQPTHHPPTSGPLKNVKNAKIVICPAFLYLSNIQYPTSNIKLGAQDCFWEQLGAYTGEISPLMLKDLGVEYVIIGHSERRRYLKETDETINKKIKAALEEKLKPILCIGETEKERKSGETFQTLKNQLKKDLKSVGNWKLGIGNLTVAYEPVWAIGGGKACNPVQAKEILLFLKKKLKKIPILYGGSVNSQNARDYIEIGFNGLLIGSASLNSEEFVKIVKNTAKT